MKYEIYIEDNNPDTAQYVSKEIFEMVERLESENSALQEKLDIAIKALELYADETSYCMLASTNKEFDGLTDEGELARKALEEINDS